MRLLKSWRVWLGCAISLLCLWLAFREVPVGELLRLGATADPVLLFLAVVFILLSVITRSWRWLVLLDRTEGLGNAFWAEGIGFLFTNIFPLRLGEPARILVMSERCQLPVMRVAASAIGGRLLDAGTNVFILLLVLPWMQVPPLIRSAGLSFGMLFLVGLGMLLLMVQFSLYGERIIQAVCSRLPVFSAEKMTARWRELVRGFLPLTRWRIAARAVGWSFVTWGCSLAVFWSVLCAFQSDARLIEAAFMMVALSFAIAVPSSPGFIGIFQFVGQQALVIPFGVKYDAATALAITLTVHLVYYIPTTTVGVVGLWRLGESFVNLGRMITIRKPSDKMLPMEEGVPEKSVKTS